MVPISHFYDGGELDVSDFKMHVYWPILGEEFCKMPPPHRSDF